MATTVSRRIDAAKTIKLRTLAFRENRSVSSVVANAVTVYRTCRMTFAIFFSISALVNQSDNAQVVSG